jgi:polysaccharide export outer membrane protein
MYRLRYLFIFSILATLLGSCGSTKKLTYLENLAETRQDSLIDKNKPGYKLQPGDILYIQVVTPDPEINKIFNPLMSAENMRGQVRGESMYYNGYSINDSGYIELPIMDTIYVNNMTLSKAKDRIKTKANKYLKKAQIITRLAKFRFTVMGEVTAPGVKQVYDNQVNIMEALAYGGDITYNGNRQNVLIIRPTGEGSKVKRIDVTNKNLIGSENYYIQPNDVIYVEPLSSTLIRERGSDYMFLLSAVSSILSTTVILLNLINP